MHEQAEAGAFRKIMECVKTKLVVFESYSPIKSLSLLF